MHATVWHTFQNFVMIALSITAWEMIKMMLEERREMKAKQKAKERAELIKAIKEEICPPIQ